MNRTSVSVKAVDFRFVDVLCLLALGVFSILILLFPDNVQSSQRIVLNSLS